MRLDEVLELLELTPVSSVKDLNAAYRRLAKKFHPDFNQRRQSWAHGKMTELNLAYETALEHFATPCTAETEQPVSRRASRAAGPVKTAGVSSHGAPSRNTIFRTRFKDAADRVLSSLYTYYQYGLENVHQRREGVRRLRYREFLEGLKKGIDLLDVLMPGTWPAQEGKNLTVFADFSKAFLQSSLIQRCFVPSSDELESGAYRHYRNGSEHLDYAIKDVFFGDMLIPIRNGTFYHRIASGYEELLVVLTKYCRSSWVSETVIKIYLLEMLTRVIGFLEKLKH